MWFWALDQREKWRAKWRQEAQAEGRAEGHASGQADLLNYMWATARAEGNLELAEEVERIAREKGIVLGEPAPHAG